MPLVMDKSKSKKGLQYLKDSPYSTEVQWDISDLPFVQNIKQLSRYLEIELNASTLSA